MWVYTPASAPNPEKSLKTDPIQQPRFTLDAAPSKSAPTNRKIKRTPSHQHQNKRPKTALWPSKSIFCYSTGLALAGLFISLYSNDGQNFLQYYSRQWLDLFTTSPPLQLFSTLFLSSMLLMTILLALGFCAFGKPAAAFLLLLYGVGSGLLSLTTYQAHGWKGILFYLLLPGLYTAVLAWSVCSLSGYSARVSHSLFRVMLQKKDPSMQRTSNPARTLMDRYLLLSMAQIVLCGVMAAGASGILRIIRI